MRIRFDKHDVIASGSLISFQGGPVEMVLGEGENAFTFRFLFKSDDVNTEERAEFESAGEKQMDIVFFNTRRAFGAGSDGPREIGALDGRKLYLSYRVYASGVTEEKLIHHTWTLGEPAESYTRSV
jgi:hypothetical protein